MKGKAQLVAAVTVATALLAGPASAETVHSILETAQEKQAERWAGVDRYVVDQKIMGQVISTWFVRTEYEDEDGEAQVFFVPMTATQIRNRQCEVVLSAEDLELFAASSEMSGNAIGDEIDGRMDEAGLPPGMLAGTGTDPWNTMDPRVMMGGNAEFLRAAAEAQRADQAWDPSEDAEEFLNHMQTFTERAELIGKETIAGREAWHLRAEGLNHVERTDDGEYIMETLSLFVDTAEYVPLSMRMNGTLKSKGRSQPMTLESLQTDYRRVPGSSMYESYRQVLNMSGMLTPEQEAQMAEAQAQLAEFEKQKASMTPQQLAMMESMMGDQLRTMEKMASGGGIEFETLIADIRVNPPLTDATGNVCPGTDNGAVAAVQATPAVGNTVVVSNAGAEVAAEVDSLTLMIQEQLAALGYNVSPTGAMDTPTAIAISQYQAENGMEVTGEPSPQLAGILAAGGTSSSQTTARSQADLQAAQQACLEQKMAEAQAAQQQKRGFGSLMRGVGRLAGQFGNYDMAQTTQDIYQTGASVEDFNQAAKDLGLKESDIAACQNPG